jgi:hypothetical protein
MTITKVSSKSVNPSWRLMRWARVIGRLGGFDPDRGIGAALASLKRGQKLLDTQKASGRGGNLAAVRATALLAATLAAAVAGLGCGDEGDDSGESPDPAAERSDPPAKPPRGWRTFANRRAGFTLSVPPGWPARAREDATLIRSRDRLVAITVAADRSEPARTTRPREYARRTFRALPGFRRLRLQAAGRVRRSPYPSIRVDGRGTLEDTRQRQHIAVAALWRPDRVTYTVVAFSANVGGAPAHAGELGTMLASLRARRPLQRSGRSG